VTEALVAIDVNSGRATKEGSVEQTALKTNLEASDEIARQLRLRDLAGLIVIDYIDMDERKNNAAVEKRFKDKLKTDRARIQVGRISGFGLLEMSRQRMRPGMLEATTQPCPHCHGTGLLRSDDNVALSILRQLEEEGTRGRSKEVLVRAPVGIANFLMNGKREHVTAIELRYGMSVRIEADVSLVSPDFAVEKFRTATRAVPEAGAAVVGGSAALMPEEPEAEEDLTAVEAEAPELEADEMIVEAAEADAVPAPEPAAAEADDRPRKRRRRRRRRGPREEGAESRGVLAEAEGDEEDDGEEGDADEADEPVPEMPAPEPVEVAPELQAPEAEAPPEAPARRTRTRSRKAAPAVEAEEVAPPEPAPKRPARARKADAAEATAEVPTAPKPRARRSRTGAATAGEPKVSLPAPADPDDPVQAAVALDDEPALDATPAADAPAPEVAREEAERLFEPSPAEAGPADAAAPEAQPEPQAEKPKRRGWWSAGR
jgi:ribonuclease E